MFLMTDAQVAEERFLTAINDMLASGDIPELFADDEIDHIVNTVAPEVGDFAGFQFYVPIMLLAGKHGDVLILLQILDMSLPMQQYTNIPMLLLADNLK